jgi:hypothetical protein
VTHKVLDCVAITEYITCMGDIFVYKAVSFALA